jgi:hypothetical protein
MRREKCLLFLFEKTLKQPLSAINCFIAITLSPEKCSRNNKYFKVNVKNKNADEVFFRTGIFLQAAM